MANLVSWAAREASEYAAKNKVSIQKAIEAIEEKYGQRVFGIEQKEGIPDFPTDPSKFLGKRSEAESRSLAETVRAGEKASTATAPVSREQSLVPISSQSKALVPVGKVQPRTSEEIRTPARLEREVEEKARPGAIKDPFAEENLRLDKALKQSRSDTSASEDYESSFGNLDTGIPSTRLPVGKVAAGTGALGTALALAGDTRRPQYSALPEGVDEKQFTASVQEALDTQKKQLENKPTTEVKKEAKKGLATTDTAAEEAQKAADKGEIPQSAADRFKQERDRAYQMYNEAKTRNEWLELAQLLGQAVTQYGAAQVGMRTGRSMAGLQIPSVDYGTRTAQEQKLLESRLRDIGQEQEREETLAERLRREKRDAAADARAERELRLREREAGLPKETAEDRAIRREERTEERKAYKEQLSALDKVVGAQEILASEDTNKKQKQKAEETLLEEANKAGLDIEQIRAQSQVPGVLGGVFGTNLDQKKVLKTIKDSIEALKSGRRGAPTSDTVAPAPAATLSAEDQQALEWAMNNPNDSRSAEIKKRLGR